MIIIRKDIKINILKDNAKYKIINIKPIIIKIQVDSLKNKANIIIKILISGGTTLSL